jgi:LysR family hydrogen peroxide-inducible transcriptional activator
VIAQIRYFLSVYEELNFTRAAERCGVSQPSLTNGIRRLEHHFGGMLFHRTRSSQSRTRPTDLALALRPHLKQIIDSAGQAHKIAAHLLAKQAHQNAHNDSHTIDAEDSRKARLRLLATA